MCAPLSYGLLPSPSSSSASASPSPSTSLARSSARFSFSVAVHGSLLARLSARGFFLILRAPTERSGADPHSRIQVDSTHESRDGPGSLGTRESIPSTRDGKPTKKNGIVMLSNSNVLIILKVYSRQYSCAPFRHSSSGEFATSWRTRPVYGSRVRSTNLRTRRLSRAISFRISFIGT